MLLVVVSIVPLICLGLFREYLDYQADRARVYDGMLSIARGTAVAVERDLQLRISSLETLAMSPALTKGNLDEFGRQAETFIARLPPGSLPVSYTHLTLPTIYSV